MRGEGRKRACCCSASCKLSLPVGQHKAASGLFEGKQNVDRRIIAACCLNMLDAPDSDCILTATADQSPPVPSFWALPIHWVY